ncbi:Interleukin cytokine receptor-related protein [Dirofilaria immitis]
MNIDFDPLYHGNCADYNHKDFVCTVRSVKCSDGNVAINESSSNTSKIVDTASRYAHDIRVEPFARVVTSYAKQTYQLSVDISWQLPPNNSTTLLLGFILEIEDAISNRSCFYFDISNSHWNSNSITTPRFHFASESLFEFDETYDIKLISLSKRKNDTTILRKHIQMPHHPDYYNDTTIEHDCKRTSNLQASRWTGGFRRILVHPIARTIQVEFVGAPPHYCFEGYEVRLKDESGLELLHTAVVPVELMYMEYFGNQTILFGEYNFTDLEVDQYFMPSVIPIERSRDGRCLCPVLSTNPFDDRMVCSCIAADWHKVRIQRMEKPLAIAPGLERNSTLILRAEHSAKEYIWQVSSPFQNEDIWIEFAISNSYYQTVILDSNAGNNVFGYKFNNRPPSTALTTLSNSRAPLIHIAQLNVLLVYSHDSLLHEKCVLLFAKYLRSVFGFDVHLDVWDIAQIERNLLDYINVSILNADKVVIINSEGAYYHYRCKIEQEYCIERKEPEPLDCLFDKQIDQVLMHSSVVSVRFKYTLPLFILPSLSCSLQYIIPDNISALISNLIDSDIKNDSRIASYSSSHAKLIATVAETSKMVENDPSWFINTHWRVPRVDTDKQNRVRIRHIMYNHVEESEDNEIKKAQLSSKPKILCESPDELINDGRNVAAVSAEMILESESLADTVEIQIVTTTDNYSSGKHNQTNQLKNFPIIDDNNSFEKRQFNDGHILHDSGFISGKSITNI